MKPKEIYELETLEEIVHWSDSSAFFSFVEKELDEELFDYASAGGDLRIEVWLKAESDAKDDPENYVAYWVIAFDGTPLGIVRLIGRHQDIWDKYITNFPLYQKMIGYVKTMYTPGDSDLVVDEELEIEDLDNLYGWVIDKESFNNMKEE